MSDGTTEARVAARWWADCLTADDSPRTGDAMNEAFVMFARSKRRQTITLEQVETFRSLLEQAILTYVREEWRGWDNAVENGPEFGSALRAIGVDYGPDPILRDTLDAAGIRSGPSGPLPLKTTMLIDPGSVRVGLGYNAPMVELPLDTP